MSSLLPLLLLLALACPLMMLFMMRGKHGGHDGTAGRGHAQDEGAFHDRAGTQTSASLDELRRRREQLDRRIKDRETEDRAPLGGRR